jgi:hypothetical protein
MPPFSWVFADAAAPFLEDAQYAEAGAAPVALRGVFLETPQIVAVGDVEAFGVLPVFDVAAQDLPDPAQGAVVTVRGLAYQVRRWEPTGGSGLRLTLERKAGP